MRELFKNKEKFLVLIDQAIVSGGNFLLVLFLSNKMSAIEFGEFALFWMIVLLISATHDSLIVAPMMNFFHRYKGPTKRRYVSNLFMLHIMFLLLLLFLCFIISLFMDIPVDLKALIGLKLILGFAYLNYVFVRKYLVTIGKQILVILCDVSVYFPILTLVYLFQKSVYFDYQVMVFGFALMPVVIFCVNVLRKGVLFSLEFIRVHWLFSKWLLLSNIIQVFSGNSLIALSGLWLGIEVVGVIRVFQNLLGVFHVFFLALENYVPVAASKIYNANGIKPLKRFIRSLFVKGSIVMFLGLIPFLIFPQHILKVVYPDGSYENFIYVFYWLSALYMLLFLAYPLRFMMRVLERTKQLFYAYLFASIIGLLVGVFLIQIMGISGLLSALVLTQLAMIIYYVKSLMYRYESSTYSNG